jgi:hypothetical protein
MLTAVLLSAHIGLLIIDVTQWLQYVVQETFAGRKPE